MQTAGTFIKFTDAQNPVEFSKFKGVSCFTFQSGWGVKVVHFVCRFDPGGGVKFNRQYGTRLGGECLTA